MHSEKWSLEIVDYENWGLFMYRSLGLTSAEPKALILIIRILIKVNAFLEESLCGIHTLMCWRKAKKVEKLLLKVCQFSNSNSTTLKSKIITLKCNCLENHSFHLLEFLKWIFWKMLNSSCFPDINFTTFFPCIFNCMQYIFNCTQQKKYRLNLFLRLVKASYPIS